MLKIMALVGLATSQVLQITRLAGLGALQVLQITTFVLFLYRELNIIHAHVQPQDSYG